MLSIAKKKLDLDAKLSVYLGDEDFFASIPIRVVGDDKKSCHPKRPSDLLDFSH